jgi:hypothetical protein
MLVLGSGSAPVAEAAAKVCVVYRLCIVMFVVVSEDCCRTIVEQLAFALQKL